MPLPTKSSQIIIVVEGQGTVDPLTHSFFLLCYSASKPSKKYLVNARNPAFLKEFLIKKKKRKHCLKDSKLFLCIYIHGSLSAGRHLCLWDSPCVITSKPVVMFYGRKMFSKHLYYLISQDVLWKIFVNSSIRRCSLNWNSAWKYLKYFVILTLCVCVLNVHMLMCRILYIIMFFS